MLTREAEYGLDPKQYDAHLDNDNDGWVITPSSSPAPILAFSVLNPGVPAGSIMAENRPYRVWGYQNGLWTACGLAVGLDTTVPRLWLRQRHRSYNGRCLAPVRAAHRSNLSYLFRGMGWRLLPYITFLHWPEAFVYHGKGKGEARWTTGLQYR